MQLEFWHERWTKGQIGWHQPEYNKHMQRYVDRLELKPGANILVPLCGKSRDMLWLAHQGFQVTGIEISPLAAKEFFEENNLPSQVTEIDAGQLYRSQHISIYCTDFFSIKLDHIPAIDGVYDRASLIALPQDMRPAYVEHLSNMIGIGCRSLLMTLVYPQQQMSGPPFSVSPREIEYLFSSRYTIKPLHSEDCLINEPRFRKKGLTSLDEHTFLLEKQI